MGAPARSTIEFELASAPSGGGARMQFASWGAARVLSVIDSRRTMYLKEFATGPARTVTSFFRRGQHYYSAGVFNPPADMCS